jgi:hypothetical protein
MPFLKIPFFLNSAYYPAFRSMFRNVVSALNEAQDIALHLRPLTGLFQVTISHYFHQKRPSFLRSSLSILLLDAFKYNQQMHKKYCTVYLYNLKANIKNVQSALLIK